MAEGEGGPVAGRRSGGGGEGSVKLFVGQVPRSMTEAQLLAVFKEVALVDGANIIRDKFTKASRGCCFLICPSRQEADKVIDACHNKRTLPGAPSPLQVKYADGELERLEHKLFIGLLPKNVTDIELTALFSKYGNIKDLHILRGFSQTSKAGCAFLKYETREQALAALESINGKHKMEGSNVPLVVKWADTEKERRARRAQKVQSQASNIANMSSNPQSPLFGALLMGYMPPYDGINYQGAGTYGIVGYPLTSVQNQQGFPSMASHANQRDAMCSADPAIPPRVAPSTFSTMQSAGFVGSGYPTIPGLQYPMTYPGGLMNHGPLAYSHGLIQPTVLSGNSVASPSSSARHGGQIEGPVGANLFIYDIPQEFGDQDLSNAFQTFGRVLSAKVFVDKATGVSKCFGFVSYDSPDAAQAAINTMNGRQMGGRKLMVQLKRENKQSKPYQH